MIQNEEPETFSYACEYCGQDDCLGDCISQIEINGYKNYDELMEYIVKNMKQQSEKLFLDDEGQIDTCLNLMIHFKWSDELLVKSGFFDKDQVQIQLQGQGVFNQYKITQKIGECQLCLEKVQLYQIGCQHYFCIDCYQQYVIISLKSSNVPLIHCLKHQCNYKIPYQMIQLLNHDAKKLYKVSLCKSFLQNNIKQACCLGDECDIILTRQESNQIDCENCYSSICVICKQYAHQPLGCDLAKKWYLKTGNSEEQTNSLIKLKYQTCYNCKQAVERTTGCNHMVCSCGSHFCYICGLIWEGHENFYKCSNATEKEYKLQTQQYFNYLAIYESYQNQIQNQIKINKQIIKRTQEISNQFGNIKIQINYVKQLTEIIILQLETIKYSSLYEYYFIIDLPEKIEIFNDYFQSYQQTVKKFTDRLEILGQLLENFHINKEQNQIVEDVCQICRFVDDFPVQYSKGSKERKKFLSLITQ